MVCVVQCMYVVCGYVVMCIGVSACMLYMYMWYVYIWVCDDVCVCVCMCVPLSARSIQCTYNNKAAVSFIRFRQIVPN